MKEQQIIRDERTVSVENASYRWGYMLLSFGLLAIVAYRGFARQESNWDLMALVILSGLVTTFYQGLHRIMSPRWGWAALALGLLSAVVAAVLVLLLRR
jgi:uncharacterized membrane protein HdeD (DUF308 family)